MDEKNIIDLLISRMTILESRVTQLEESHREQLKRINEQTNQFKEREKILERSNREKTKRIEELETTIEELRASA